MANLDPVDYRNSGMSIQYAVLDQVKRFPDKKTRPPYILWGDLHVATADDIPVPTDGIFRAEFLAGDHLLRQGFDLRAVNGWIQLRVGELVPVLRTGKDERLDDVIQYPFHSEGGLLRVWNVYERVYPSGERATEMWTGNAGFWVERLGDRDHVYHCSSGFVLPPNFESLVFRLSIK
jgi:hypothetical protein